MLLKKCRFFTHLTANMRETTVITQMQVFQTFYCKHTGNDSYHPLPNVSRKRQQSPERGERHCLPRCDRGRPPEGLHRPGTVRRRYLSPPMSEDTGGSERRNPGYLESGRQAAPESGCPGCAAGFVLESFSMHFNIMP